MDSFLNKFFPEVLRGMKSAKRDAYCKYDNQLLTAFTSSMYIAAMLASLVASSVTRRVGRKAVMLIGGIMFLAGSVINAGAVNVAMLIVGRILLGFGVGFTAQAAPLYLAEISPTRWRGGFTTAYHFFLVAGTLAANVANYVTNRIPDWGWRVSLGLAAVPSAVIVMGALLVSDTPSSLVLRGEPYAARASLQRVRGAGADVEAELKDIICAVEAARRDEEEGAFRRLRAEGYRHYLVMMVAIPAFFDLTGMVVISVFSPVLFRTVGFDSQRAIFGAVIISLVSLCGVALSTLAVDRCGRRFLFLAGGTAMLLFQVAVSWVLADHLGKHQAVTMPKNYAMGVVVLVCLYTFSFSMSWGPLKWVVPSEIYPVEIRSAGQAITLSVALTLSFTQTQVFISMLCAMKYAIFLFYSGWVLAMTLFVAAFLPETKGVPLETMRSVWARHWFWRKFVVLDAAR
ncbi:Sugar transport protein 5 [Zea mays]|uniref:Sugar transport protein 5 n=2 Tax=Zea mays TaxID=4577 RepID=A0A1D6J7U0_MAIZE|nr:Sugar transport protein 5 [Zea mays]